MSIKWDQTNKDHPCPICGQSGHCGVATNGSACICHNVKSALKADTGGWWHPLRKITPEDFPPDKRYGKKHGKPAKKAPSGPFEEKHFTSLQTGDPQHKFCEMLAEKLGVETRALESLDVRWDETQKAAAFPMRTADGRFYTGVAYRYVKTGQKFNAKGGVAGLFMPLDLNLYNGHLIVCEGASDTAAVLSMGLRNVVGRPGCRACETMVDQLCRLRRIDHVTILADNDEPQDGMPVGVGIAGAQHLAQTLEESARTDGRPIETKIVLPQEGFKDFREQYTAKKKGGD